MKSFSFLLHIYDIKGVIEQSSSNRQVLDKLPVERQRGITVKAQTAAIFTSLEDQSYMVNLIDTPVSLNPSHDDSLLVMTTMSVGSCGF